jgi:pyruvate kinase
MQRKARIIATIGPATRDKETLKELFAAGMDVARINTSHAQPAEVVAEIELLKEVREELGRPLAILLDLAGPKIRIGELEGGVAILKFGQEYVLTTRAVKGDANQAQINIPFFPADLLPGDSALLDDGAIRLRVEKMKGEDVDCRVEVGGELKSRKGVSFPGRKLNLPNPTDKDIRNLEIGLQHGADWIALSLVRSVDDVRRLRENINFLGYTNPIIAKIERSEALQDIDAIITEADAIMVARGDLGVECPIEEVPILQKDLVNRTAHIGRPSVVATQMMESMIYHSYPTRAEASDITNAIYDGADSLMLSAETAVGKFPVQTVKVMAKIIERSEGTLPFHWWRKKRELLVEHGPVEATCYAACELARNINAAAIVAITESGFTALQMARFRPESMIIAITPHVEVTHRLKLAWGVYPILQTVTGTLEERFHAAARAVLEAGWAREGDRVVITAGLKDPSNPVTTTNTVKVEQL